MKRYSGDPRGFALEVEVRYSALGEEMRYHTLELATRYTLEVGMRHYDPLSLPQVQLLVKQALKDSVEKP